MKLHGVKSVVAAAVATSLVGFVVATSNDPVTTVEAVPVIANPEVLRASPPTRL